MLRWFFVALAAWHIAMGVASAQDRRWARAETEHFIVYSNDFVSRTEEVARQLEYFHSLLERVTQLSDAADAPKLEVYVFASHRHMREVIPDLPQAIGGFYLASTDIIGSFGISNERIGLDSPEIIFHEYAHHFMFQHFNYGYPAWYVEGFAEYMQTAEVSARRLTWGRPSVMRGGQLANGGAWLSLGRVLRRENIDTLEDRSRYYAQSWLLTHYMLSVPENRPRLQDYLRRVAAGEAADTALYAAFGETEEAIQRRLRTYANGRVTYTELELGAPLQAEVTVRRLSSAANALLPLVARLRLDLSTVDDAALLAEIAEEAADHPEDAYAQRALAFAETKHGSTARAREILAPIIAADAADRDAHYITGLAWLRDARAGDAAARLEARRAFVRAFRLDDTHVPTLYRYVETFTDLNQPLSARDLDVLLRAHDLAPQVFEIGGAAATQLAAARRYREAIAVLTPFAQDPHGGPRAERARAMIAAYTMGEGMRNEAAGAAPAAP